MNIFSDLYINVYVYFMYVFAYLHLHTRVCVHVCACVCMFLWLNVHYHCSAYVRFSFSVASFAKSPWIGGGMTWKIGQQKKNERERNCNSCTHGILTISFRYQKSDVCYSSFWAGYSGGFLSETKTRSVTFKFWLESRAATRLQQDYKLHFQKDQWVRTESRGGRVYGWTTHWRQKYLGCLIKILRYPIKFYSFLIMCVDNDNGLNTSKEMGY